MTKIISVTYDGRVLRPNQPLDLEPNTHYEISVNGMNGANGANTSGKVSPYNGVVTENLRSENGAGANSASDELASITVTLPASQVRELEALAEQLRVSSELLIRSSIKELLIPLDADYQRGTEYLMTKNPELYRRLA